MKTKRFIQFASIFIMAVALAAFPRMARADDDDGTLLLGDGGDSGSAPECGSAFESSCSTGVLTWTCSVTCRTGYYACCYVSNGPHCICKSFL